MDLTRGYVRNWRGIDQWQWYTAPHHAHVFQHMIRRANHRDGFWRGIDITRGQFITSQGVLGAECGVGRQTIRTILTNLKGTGEVCVVPTRCGSLITICNYETYQYPVEQANHEVIRELTSVQPASNQRPTSNKNEENEKKPKKKKKERRFTPPTEQEVQKYAASKGWPDFNAGKFIEYYAEGDWHDGQGNPVRNWKQKFLAVWLPRRPAPTESVAPVERGSDGLTPRERYLQQQQAEEQ